VNSHPIVLHSDQSDAVLASPSSGGRAWGTWRAQVPSLRNDPPTESRRAVRLTTTPLETQ